MAMPHPMNCAHLDTGWCLDCVKRDRDRHVELLDESQGEREKLEYTIRGLRATHLARVAEQALGHIIACDHTRTSAIEASKTFGVGKEWEVFASLAYTQACAMVAEHERRAPLSTPLERLEQLRDKSECPPGVDILTWLGMLADYWDKGHAGGQDNDPVLLGEVVAAARHYVAVCSRGESPSSMQHGRKPGLSAMNELVEAVDAIKGETRG